MEGYLLEQGTFGLRAVLNSPWNQDIHSRLLKLPIAELELNDGKGWRGQDLSFLTDFTELLAFKILTRKTPATAHESFAPSLQSTTTVTASFQGPKNYPSYSIQKW